MLLPIHGAAAIDQLRQDPAPRVTLNSGMDQGRVQLDGVMRAASTLLDVHHARPPEVAYGSPGRAPC